MSPGRIMPLLIMGQVAALPPPGQSDPPPCRHPKPSEDRPKMTPEKKITATTNTTPATIPTQAAA